MADLLQSWFDKNAVGSDYMPKLVQMGMSLRNDVAKIEMQKQQLQNQYMQFQAEAARANQQAQFQDRKFAYSIQQDQMQNTRQNMLDARAGKYQDAQIANWGADNQRAQSAEEFNKTYREAQMKKWSKDNDEGENVDFSWINGDAPAAGAPATDTYLPEDGAATTAPPQNYNTGGDAGLPSWGEQGGVTSELVSPVAPDAPRAVPVAEPYAGSEGAVGASGPAGQPSDSLANHPGRAKWESVQRASVLDRAAISGMKSAERTAALKALGQIAILKQDPDVLDYERRLQAQTSAAGASYQQDQMDKAQEEGFGTDARVAARQLKSLNHYVGAELPFGESTESSPAYSREMQNLRKGIPAKDWMSVATAEEKAQLDKEVGDELDWRNEVEAERRRKDTSIEGRVDKAVTKADSAAILESRQFNEIQTKWANENPDAMRVIEQAAIAAKSGGQPPSQEQILKQIDAAIAESSTLGDRMAGYTSNRPLKEVFSAPSFTDARSQYLHPNPDKRDTSGISAEEASAGMTAAQRLTGRPLANKDIALMIYNRMIATGPVVDSVEKYNALKSGESYRDEKGIPRVKK